MLVQLIADFLEEILESSHTYNESVWLGIGKVRLGIGQEESQLWRVKKQDTQKQAGQAQLFKD